MSNPTSTEPLRRLADYIVWLYIRWQTYKDLFGRSEERVKKLNRRTGQVFRVVQDALLDNVQVEIAKLLDKATICGNKTLTFAGILKDAPIPVGDPRRVGFEADLEALRRRFEPILIHRHRRADASEASSGEENEQTMDWLRAAADRLFGVQL